MGFLFATFNFVRTYVMGFVLFAAIVATWKVQDWRYSSLEESYLKKEQSLIQAEAKQEAKAATKFEKKQEATNDTYDQINKALGKTSTGSGSCFTSDQLRLLNSALARKTPHPG